LFCSAVASTSAESDPVNLYRVTIRSHDEAEKLSGLDLSVFFRVSRGYLVLASSRGYDKLFASDLEFRLVATDVARRHLALDIWHDDSNLGRYPLVFQEGGIRIFHVEDTELIGGKGTGLAPIRTEHIPVVYQTAPRLDESMADRSTELDTLLGRVQQDSLISYMEFLQSLDGRLAGTYGTYATAHWLRENFLAFGYDSVFFDAFTAVIDGRSTTCRNVVACKPGTDYPFYQIIVTAHYDSPVALDSPGLSPGADDNGSGTTGVLEIARALAGIDTKFTFIFILFDAEEAGLLGSWHYAEAAAARDDRIMLLLNMDMIGNYENDHEAKIYHNVGEDTFGQVWGALADSIPGIDITAHVGPFSTGTGSDHVPFLQYGYDAVYTKEYIISTVYHSFRDSTTYINFDYLTRMVKASLATTYVIDQQFVPDYELYMAAVDSLPWLLFPNTPTRVAIVVREYGGASLLPGSVRLHYSVDGGDTVVVSMTAEGDDFYAGCLPALPCMARATYFFSADDETLGTCYFPPPGDPLGAVSATGMYSVFEDDFGTDKGWNSTGITAEGKWMRSNTAELDFGMENDYDGNNMCYVTGANNSSDVDGTTTLISPAVDGSSGDLLIRYARWFYSLLGRVPDVDEFRVYVSNNNGLNWHRVETLGPYASPDYGWVVNEFWLSRFMTPSAFVKLRFDACDLGEDSYVKAGIDAVQFMGFSSDPRIITEYLPNWTAGFPYSYQLTAAVCEGGVTWVDRFGQLEGTGLALSPEGMLSGIPTRVGPVVFRAQITDQYGQNVERLLDLIIYDSLHITTLTIPTVTVDEPYDTKIRSYGGSGEKIWSDRDGDLAGTGILLFPDGRLYGTAPADGAYTFVARVIDEVGAFDERPFLLRIIGPYICGDANSDGSANIADAVHLINYVFRAGLSPEPLEAGDANCDGNINVGDAVYLINYVFKGGSEPCCP